MIMEVLLKEMIPFIIEYSSPKTLIPQKNIQ